MAGLIAAACTPQPPVLEAGASVCALIFGEDDGARAAAIKGLEAAGWQTVTEPSPKCQPNVFTTVVALPVEDGMGSTLAHSVTLSSWAGGVTLTPLGGQRGFFRAAGGDRQRREQHHLGPRSAAVRQGCG